MGHRAWVFTLNNPVEGLDFGDYPAVRYAIYQLEAGVQGTPHFQGYIEFSAPQRHSAVRKMLHGAHIEPRKGSRDQARDYCRKSPSLAEPVEFGRWISGRGCRTDLLSIKEDIDNGMAEDLVADTYFGSWCRYYKAFREYRRIKTPHRDFKTEVIVLWGPTGTGKSRLALRLLPEAYWKAPDGAWFDGYDSGDIVLDDYYGWLPYSLLLRLLDRYPLNVQTKGGHTAAAPHLVVITSNLHPSEWYTGISRLNPGWYDALERRITWIFHVTDPLTFAVCFN